MATTLSPTVVVNEKKPKLGGGGPGKRPPRGGDWGGGRGDGPPDFGDRLRRYRIGMIVGLTPVLMLFVAFTSAYIVRQGLGTWDTQTNAYITDWRAMSLPPLLWVNTIILLFSSVTLEMARRTLGSHGLVLSEARSAGLPIREREFPWLPVTVVLGMAFLAGQAVAWRQLEARGVYMATNPSSSFFYLLTGAHALHLLGGLIALMIATFTAASSKSWQRRRLVVDITSWYWHFMALLWVYIFALLHFAK